MTVDISGVFVSEKSIILQTLPLADLSLRQGKDGCSCPREIHMKLVANGDWSLGTPGKHTAETDTCSHPVIWHPDWSSHLKLMFSSVNSATLICTDKNCQMYQQTMEICINLFPLNPCPNIEQSSICCTIGFIWLNPFTVHSNCHIVNRLYPNIKCFWCEKNK